MIKRNAYHPVMATATTKDYAIAWYRFHKWSERMWEAPIWQHLVLDWKLATGQDPQFLKPFDAR